MQRGSRETAAWGPGAGRQGFTLVELLVVVAIIVVLIAVMLPALSKAREQARRVACLSNMRQVGMGMNTYAHEMNQVLPIADSGGTGWGHNGSGWITRLINGGNVASSRQQNILKRDAFFCPADRVSPTNANSAQPGFSSYKVILALAYYGVGGTGQPAGVATEYNSDGIVNLSYRLNRMPNDGANYYGIKFDGRPVPVAVEEVYATSTGYVIAPWDDYLSRPGVATHGLTYYTSTPHANANRSVLYNDFSVQMGVVEVNFSGSNRLFLYPTP